MHPAMILAAQHIAMRAKLNEVDPHDVDDMRTRAEEVLDHGSDFYRAITSFATRYQVVRYEPDELAREGRWLDHAIEKELGLVRALPERRDLDG
jgi:hypothetical protein